MKTHSQAFFLLSLITLMLSLQGCDSQQSATESVPQTSSIEEAPEAADSASASLAQILDDYYEDSLRLFPLNATFEGDSRYNNRFTNLLDPQIQDAVAAHYGKYQALISELDASELSDTEKMTKEVFEWEMQINLAELDFEADLTPLDQMWTDHLTIGQLASGGSAQPFKTVEDYNAWMQRVDEYLVWLASTEVKMREGMEKNYVLPKSLIKKVLPQLSSMATTNLDEHLFFNPIRNLPDDFTSEEKQELTEAFESMILTKVAPAYQKLHDFMAGEYMQAGRDSSGIDAVPNGAAYYQHQIKKYTTTDMTADEVHELGLSEVARIRGEMEKVKAEVGFEGELLAFFEHVRNNEELMPFDDPAEVIDYFNSIHQRMKPQVDRLFSKQPTTPFEVRRTEAFREKSAAAEYNPGSLDGTRPGVFYTPIPDARKYNVFDSESLFLHEAIPGHHFQISLTQENEELPKFRKTLWYSGYGEGWALYTESLGKELGLYTDPYQYFGMLSAEMHRAIRLVVDSGMHAKGWTREQAIQYSLENEAESAESIEREIERYMANPGQALAYKIGQLKIRQLRDSAEAELGANFDIGEFHREVLETGCVPLALLENKINRWVASQKT